MFNTRLLNPEILPTADVRYLDAWARDERGRICLRYSHEWRAQNLAHVRYWCHKNAVYGIPTQELVAFLHGVIRGRSALEVTAGNGDLGYHLGIVQTDSFFQARHPVAALTYSMMQQPTTRPGVGVFCLDANVAARLYRPQVVIASWCCHRWNGVDGNAFGPDESEFFEHCETYIHIGHLDTHASKPLLKRPGVRECVRPWLVSRAKDQGRNVIHVWHR